MLARLRDWLAAAGRTMRNATRRPATEAQAAALRRIEGQFQGIAAQLEQLARAVEQVRMAQTATLDDTTALTLCASGQLIYVDTRCRDIAPHLMMSGQWEANYLEAFRRLLRPADVVLDVGANHGVYTLAAAAAVGPQGKVHAFEANPRYARLLRETIQLNGLTGIAQVHRVAVSDASGEAEFRFGFEHAGGGRLSEGDEQAALRMGQNRKVSVRTVALDALFRQSDFVVNAVKLDVEGHEGRALKGMRRLLERSPDVRIMLEFAPSMMRDTGVDSQATVALLEDLGFRFWDIAPDSELVPVEAAELRGTDGGIRNIVAARADPTS